MEETTQNSEKSKPVKKRTVPTADIDFGNVITNVSTKWTANNWLTLKWLTALQFKNNAASYNTILDARMNSGATKPQISQALKNLDNQMDEHLSYV